MFVVTISFTPVDDLQTTGKKKKKKIRSDCSYIEVIT